jgi:hypothetical protein
MKGGHKSHHHGKHHKGGGRTGLVASGNPDVIKEAKGEEPYDKGDEKKHGGKVKKHHGKHHRATGGKVPATKSVGFMTGGGVRPRLDKPGRKRGGRVGSDRAPLSSAHHSSAAESMPKTQEGGMSD